MAKRVLRSPERPRNPQMIHPEREWLIGLSLATILFVGSTAVAVQEYAQYRDVTLTDNGSTEEIVIYREHMVNEALLKFSERSTEHQSLLNQIGVSKVEEVITPSETSEEPTTEATPEVMPEIEDDTEEDTVVVEEETTDEVPLIVE